MADSSEFDIEQVMNAKKASTMKETDRKCPQCGGTMDYDPAILKLHCPFCDYTEEIPAAEVSSGKEKAEELDFASAESTGNFDWGTEQKTVTCKSCGAVSVYDALDVANECPYCGSNQVMEASGIDTLAPGGVVPFKITKETAGNNFTKWLKKKWFCPGKAKQSAKAESFQGVYLPYWTFDTLTNTDYRAEYGKDRKVKNGKQETTVTDWYNTSGNYTEFIDDQLVCGSDRHDRSILGAIEPFDTEDNRAYKPEYLAGFIAERYSRGLKDAWTTGKFLIQKRLEGNISSRVRTEHHADHVRNIRMNTVYSQITYKYLMLPIWISSFTFKGKIYQFMVNGQSGKVGGKSPVSALRVLLAILLGLAIIVLLYYLT
ncbi:MAG: hypothetical protein K5770_14550 [Lachnospiraceae bacterium]|nr:hypothetical protein [Lachnospiraceae bacterium]